MDVRVDMQEGLHSGSVMQLMAPGTFSEGLPGYLAPQGQVGAMPQYAQPLQENFVMDQGFGNLAFGGYAPFQSYLHPSPVHGQGGGMVGYVPGGPPEHALKSLGLDPSDPGNNPNASGAHPLLSPPEGASAGEVYAQAYPGLLDADTQQALGHSGLVGALGLNTLQGSPNPCNMGVSPGTSVSHPCVGGSEASLGSSPPLGRSQGGHLYEAGSGGAALPATPPQPRLKRVAATTGSGSSAGATPSLESPLSIRAGLVGELLPGPHAGPGGGGMHVHSHGDAASSHGGGGASGTSGGGARRPSGPAGARRSGGADRGARSSQFRGVTKHRRSGRYEAHIWVKDLGRQVYLGGYECEEHAAEAYDIAALKCKGRRGCKTNFELSKYGDLLGCIDRMTMEELVMAVRRQSQGFSRGTSSFRGVTHHPSGRWEARIGVPGSKHIYLGLFVEERDAARAYDRALVRLRGRGAATNFALSDYKTEMADYHRMQAKLLGTDPQFGEISASPALFERWVKGGCEAFPELGGGAREETPPPHVLDASSSHHPLDGGFGGGQGTYDPVPAASGSKHGGIAPYTLAAVSSDDGANQ